MLPFVRHGRKLPSVWMVWLLGVLLNRSSAAATLCSSAEFSKPERDHKAISINVHMQHEIPCAPHCFWCCSVRCSTISYACSWRFYASTADTSQAVGIWVSSGNGCAAVTPTSRQACVFCWAKTTWDLPACCRWVSELAHLTFMYLNTALWSAV